MLFLSCNASGQWLLGYTDLNERSHFVEAFRPRAGLEVIHFLHRFDSRCFNAVLSSVLRLPKADRLSAVRQRLIHSYMKPPVHPATERERRLLEKRPRTRHCPPKTTLPNSDLKDAHTLDEDELRLRVNLTRRCRGWDPVDVLLSLDETDDDIDKYFGTDSPATSHLGTFSDDDIGEAVGRSSPLSPLNLFSETPRVFGRGDVLISSSSSGYTSATTASASVDGSRPVSEDEDVETCTLEENAKKNTRRLRRVVLTCPTFLPSNTKRLPSETSSVPLSPLSTPLFSNFTGWWIPNQASSPSKILQRDSCLNFTEDPPHASLGDSRASVDRVDDDANAMVVEELVTTFPVDASRLKSSSVEEVDNGEGHVVVVEQEVSLSGETGEVTQVESNRTDVDPLPLKQPQSNGEATDLSSENSVHVCRLCDAGVALFSTPALLYKHLLRRHFGSFGGRCRRCGVSFKTATGLKGHRARCRERIPFFCHVCRRSWGSLSSLKMHEECGRGDKRHRCFCGESFHYQSVLRIHQKSCASF